MKKITLSEILEKAGTNETYREEFYRRFLDATVYVLTPKEAAPNRLDFSKDLSKLSIVVFPNQVIPVFTELDRVLEQESITAEVTAVPVNGRTFLEMAKDSAVVVNPFSNIYKELIPLEISEMLSGSMFNKKANILKTKQNMSVQIGQPQIYPTELVQCLTAMFETMPEVKKAHIGWIYNPIIGDPPHYIFAIDCKAKDMKRITDQASVATRPFVSPEQIVDYMQLEEEGDISRYFYEHTEPFYTIR